MQILFLGGFARGYQLLQMLLDRRESVVGAFICEEDPHERTKFAGNIESLCRDQEVPFTRTRKIRKSQAAEIAERFKPDVIFCCGWRTMIPSEILEVAPYGVIAAHDSLLPKLRGFAPTNWAVLLGEDEVGATLFRLSAGVDEGEVYFQESFPVTPSDTMECISQRIAVLSVGLFERYLRAVRDGSLCRILQQHECATYGCARTPEDGEICWTASTGEIVRLVRALGAPGPGAYTYHDRRILRVLKASTLKAPVRYEGCIPGRVVGCDPANGTIDVLTGDGVLRLEQVERDDVGLCAPATLIKSVRAFLGVKASVEIARLHDAVERLESKYNLLQKRVAAIEERQ